MKALTEPPDSGPCGTRGSRSAEHLTVPNPGEGQEFESAGRVVTGRCPASRPVAVSPNLVHRAASTLRPPLWDEVKDLLYLYAQKRHGAVVRHDSPMDAHGLPVLLVGGFTSTERALSPLREWLDRLNCRCLVAPIRYGVSCGAQGARYVEQALERLTDATGQPAVVIAHSRGGHYEWITKPSGRRCPNAGRSCVTRPGSDNSGRARPGEVPASRRSSHTARREGVMSVVITNHRPYPQLGVVETYSLYETGAVQVDLSVQSA